MTTQLTIKNEGRGRKTGSKTVAVRNAVVRTIKDSQEPMTTNAVAKKIKKNKVSVIQTLRWLEQKGYVQKAGTEKVKQGKGRPSVVWAVVEDYVAIDRAQQAYVQEKRAFVRQVSAMTPEDRRTMVVISLSMLAERQTEDEVEEKESLYTNKQGFTKADAKRGVEDSQKESLTMKEVNYWLNGSRLFKYRKQLDLA